VASRPDLSLQIFPSSNDNYFESTLKHIIYFVLHPLFTRQSHRSLFIQHYGLQLMVLKNQVMKLQSSESIQIPATPDVA
jgi:hypothetical protein